MISANDPTLRSFIEVAPESDFPIQNLPFGIARIAGSRTGRPFAVIAIGDHAVNLAALEEAGTFETPSLRGKTVFAQAALNAFIGLGRPAWRDAREVVSMLLRHDNPTLRDNPDSRNRVLLRQSELEMLLPVEIGDYTDFYSSREHATNVGVMFRGAQNALMPNWLHLPVGYHGRASSIVVSGTPVRRPCGQTNPTDAAQPLFGACKQLDFELESGLIIGTGNPLGEPISVDHAEEHLFGMVLMNDWSARDIQRWEYVPLGPFLAKNFQTSISPWIVTMDALEPFRCDGPMHDPEPLPYLKTARNKGFDLQLEVSVTTTQQLNEHVISRTNHKYMYWNAAHQIAHHTVTGCNLRTGDLLGSGTISGPEKAMRGSMLELAWKGTEPLMLPSGESRKFIEDGDTVIMRGWCQGDGYRVGFGDVRGTVLPALEL